MAKMILMEEFHVTVLAPAGLPKTSYAAVVRTLNSNRFQIRLHDAIEKVRQRHSSLNPLKFSISR